MKTVCFSYEGSMERQGTQLKMGAEKETQGTQSEMERQGKKCRGNDRKITVIMWGAFRNAEALIEMVGSVRNGDGGA